MTCSIKSYLSKMLMFPEPCPFHPLLFRHVCDFGFLLPVITIRCFYFLSLAVDTTAGDFWYIRFLTLHAVCVLPWCPIYCNSFLHSQALQPGALQPLPKRPALEKSNGATTMFNPSVFHYQQALANMQLQQTAFIPTGKRSKKMHIYNISPSFVLYLLP